MVNCALAKVTMACDVKCSILAHALFILYNKSHKTSKCNEYMWTPYGVLLGEFIFPVFRGGVHVVQMEQLESNWTPHGICGGG